jgi:hypothetical protein
MEEIGKISILKDGSELIVEPHTHAARSFLAAEWLCGLDPAAWAGWLAEIAAVVGSSFTPS